MNLARARELYGLDLLTEFTAVPCSDDDERSAWMLCIQGKDDKAWTLETSLHHPKLYATLQSLSADVCRIMGATARQPWTMRL